MCMRLTLSIPPLFIRRLLLLNRVSWIMATLRGKYYYNIITCTSQKLKITQKQSNLSPYQ